MSNPDGTPTIPPEQGTVIWSGEHRAWWRRGEDGGGRGYTTEFADAGVWSRAQAEAMVRTCGPEKKIMLEPSL